MALCAPECTQDSHLGLGQRPVLGHLKRKRTLNNSKNVVGQTFTLEGSDQRLTTSIIATTGHAWYLLAAWDCMTPEKSNGSVNCKEEQHMASFSDARRIGTKYIASLISMSMRLYMHHPMTASVLFFRFQHLIWALFLRCKNCHVVRAIVDSFAVLEKLWDRRLIEFILARALRAASQTDAILHAKVGSIGSHAPTCCSFLPMSCLCQGCTKGPYKVSVPFSDMCLDDLAIGGHLTCRC